MPERRISFQADLVSSRLLTYTRGHCHVGSYVNISGYLPKTHHGVRFCTSFPLTWADKKCLSASSIQEAKGSARTPSREPSNPSAAMSRYVEKRDQYQAFLVGAMPSKASRTMDLCRVTQRPWERLGGDENFIQREH